ncbi:MAG: phage baseplate assembly protein V [Acidobacteriota bacterium]|nr:phage baseplate assembly protein V [Acidobacteriota bacterium]
MQTMGGVYPATVIDNRDPEMQGRVRLTIPAAPDTQSWARVATLAGARYIPEIGTEVLVAFEAGDADLPYMIGRLWNALDQPQAASGQITIETPGGQRITLEDGAGSVTIADSNGNSVKLGPGGIEINSAGIVTVNAASLEFRGVLKADTVVAGTVVAGSFAPSAGNIW